jgi:anhydro-N-acetylmuramic acid kinase
MITKQVSRSSYNSEIGIGLMSGTSTDGLDIVAIQFSYVDSKYRFEVLDSHFTPYSNEFAAKLRNCDKSTARELRHFEILLSEYFAEQINVFKQGKAWKAGFVASHGHTVFHDPKSRYTLQIGDGATIAVLTGLPCVSNFRQGDVSLGGQGAPLVPIGDELLFNEYEYALNLGGFANVSFQNNSQRIAFDICPLNIVMNELAMKLGHSYDSGGELSRSGKLIPELLEELNSIEYYQMSGPKSLGTEWVNEYINPILSAALNAHQTIDILNTFVEHSAMMIGNVLKRKGATVLSTGGGCKNKYLIERIQRYSLSDIYSTNEILVDYKEALIFAFLGYLRINEVNSTIIEVTGAIRSHSAGAVYLP